MTDHVVRVYTGSSSDVYAHLNGLCVDLSNGLYNRDNNVRLVSMIRSEYLINSGDVIPYVDAHGQLSLLGCQLKASPKVEARLTRLLKDELYIEPVDTVFYEYFDLSDVFINQSFKAALPSVTD